MASEANLRTALGVCYTPNLQIRRGSTNFCYKDIKKRILKI
jgi:hypothetical protein